MKRYGKQQIGDAFINKLASNYKQIECLWQFVQENRVWHSWPTASPFELTEIIPVWIPGWNGETRNTGLTRVVRRWRTSGPAIRGVLLDGMPNLSIYLYTCLLLFLTDVLLPSSLSLSDSLARFFSAIKIYAHSRTRCVHIAFRLVQCSFCAGLRTRAKRAFVHIHRCTFRDMIPSFSRVFPTSPWVWQVYLSLRLAIGRDFAVVVGRKISTKSKRARQRDHRWRYSFSGIAVVPLWKLGLLFIEIRMALKKRERDGRRRGAVSSNHPTKQKASG